MESSSASPRLADTPIFPFQHLLDLAPLVQDLATKYIVRQRAVAPILAQCPAADFQHTHHLTVAQVHVFFWRNRAISEMPSIIADSRSIRSWMDCIHASSFVFNSLNII